MKFAIVALFVMAAVVCALANLKAYDIPMSHLYTMQQQAQNQSDPCTAFQSAVAEKLGSNYEGQVDLRRISWRVQNKEDAAMESLHQFVRGCLPN